nr:hypothetical protein BaRGS_027332 [Batillaria attramentaria]
MGKEVSKDFLTLACYNAVATGQLGLLKALQKTGKAPQVDKQGNTPLHVAAKCGQLKCLNGGEGVSGGEVVCLWLMQYCSVPLLAKNARGETCAHTAALHGNLKCLQAILAEPKDVVGELAAAAERDNAGMTCLHHATMGNRDCTVAWLANAFGKDLCLVKSMDGVLAIHLATASGNLACTEALIQVCRQSVNMRDVFGATPVFYAAQEGQLEILKYLVEEAEGSLDLVACEGMTPLLTAAEGGHLDIIKYILGRQGKAALLATTHDGATAFHFAAGNGNASVLRYLLETPDRREMLGVADMYDRTPAHDAAENGHVECLQLLAEQGVSLYLPDKDGETALSMAMRSANPQCVMFARALAEAAMEKCNSKSFKSQ